jgi:hypothetical protein
MNTTAAAEINGRTADEWAALAAKYRQDARLARQASADSFERCDTDGFLSQWASDTIAREYDRKAEWADEHGFVTIPALIGLDGATLVAWRQVTNRYGTSWLATDEGERLTGRRFLNDSNARRKDTRLANNRKKGFTFGRVRVPGSIHLRGGNLTSVTPVPEPDRDAIEAGVFEIVDPEITFSSEE